MKNQTFLAIVAIVFLFTFTSCENDSLLEEQNPSAKTISDQNPSLHNLDKPELETNGGPIGGTISVKVKFRLHRGRKWAKKHHTQPCQHSFGFCTTGISGSATVNISTKTQAPSRNSTSVFRCEFLKPVEAKDGDIFFSTEDAPFAFPTDIAQEMGFNNITIVPEDYIYQGPSKDYPYGYVDVDCITN